MAEIKKKKNIKVKVKKTVAKKPRTKKVGLKKTALTKKGIHLKRAIQNPIIEPGHYAWESKATFNPSAILAHDKVHIIYRAIGNDDSSVLGYAASADGFNFYERAPYAVYRRDNNFTKADL